MTKLRLAANKKSLQTASIYVVAGVLLGLAFISSHFAGTAWLAIAAYNVALERTHSSLAVFVSIAAAHGLTCMIAFPWMWAGNFVIFDYSLEQMVALRFGEAMILAVPYAIALSAFHAIFRSRIAGRFWFPFAWGAGEVLSFATSNACVDDWLNTQWTVTPILRALAWVGWWPLVLASLFAAASLGDALMGRRWKIAIPSVVVVAAIVLAPPIEDGKTERLEGIGAMHLTPAVALPHTLPQDVELLVWPETAVNVLPLLSEGPGKGASIPPLVPGHKAQHLVGLRTKLPGGVMQNQAVAVEPDGRVIASRAKRLFVPVAERQFLGVGRTRYRSGEGRPLLDLSGRSIVPLVCGEGLSRGLLAEGVAEGGRIWAVLAGDQWLASERALQQFLAIQVLRSVEFSIPSIRASYAGHSTFVSADGRVLAVSGLEQNGVLVWNSAQGARDYDFRGRLIDGGPRPIDPPPDIAVLYSRASSELRARCPEGACLEFSLESFTCPKNPAKVVIVSGHGAPPDYLGHPVADVAAAIRCFEPELVVIDTCFGASSELLSALGTLDAIVVAAASLLPTSGFVYGPSFFESQDPWVRAAAVRTIPETALLRWHNNPPELAALLARVDEMEPTELSSRLARRRPATVRVELEQGGPLLVPIDWKRLGPSRPPPRMRGQAMRD